MIESLIEIKEEPMRISKTTAIFLMLMVSSFLVGCSISYSTGKSSDSISASSDSISASSDGDDNTAAAAINNYAEDVAAATMHYASSTDESGQFLQTIANIARSHGIVDWEQVKLTFTAMGKGLKQAGVEEETISTLAYFDTLPKRADYLLVLKGYRQS